MAPKSRGFWVIPLSFVVAYVLTLVPLPEPAEPYRPNFVSMVLIYWCIAAPDRVGVGVGWMCGLFLDFLSFSLIGQNALAKSVVAYFARKFYLRIRMFPMWQQAVVTFLLIAIDTALVGMIYGIVNNAEFHLSDWLPALSSMIFWPLGFALLNSMRQLSGLRR